MSEPSDSLREQFGDIDVYLFDQLLRGRIVSGMKVLDAGCGSGRHLIYLMRAGFDMWGIAAYRRDDPDGERSLFQISCASCHAPSARRVQM